METIRAKILEYLASQGSHPVKLGQLLKALGLPATDRKHIRRVLREMAADGALARLAGQQFVLPSRAHEIVGILRASSKGFGFVQPAEDYIHGSDRREIFIPAKRMADALDRDKVLVRIRGETGRSPEGEVVEVIERGTNEIVGTFYHTKRGGQIIPRNERFTRAIQTPRPDPNLGIEDGTYVVADILQWTAPAQPLIGKVREVLGDVDTPGIDITMIIRDAGVEPEFPEPVLLEAAGIPDAAGPDELAKRIDFRDMVTFTMDGRTAKDFDDALSISRNGDGIWSLGVHVADVSHYVREGSALDEEAFERGTSIYPIDRVVPMLPEKLSNNICSLRPNEDRLTLSCLMEIDGRGRVHGYSIHESVIRSRHRLVYEDVQRFMDGKADGNLLREHGDIRQELEELYALRKVLTAMRIRRGALDLDIPETEIDFHDDGTVAGICRRSRLEAHRVVEECMLIANEVVASHLFNLHVPSVYRIHEDPDMNKLHRLQPVLAHMGIRFPARKDITSDAIQIALEKAGQLETGFIARRLILRAMMQAHYEDENLGHFGLASSCYTHFTSPIRRYPDLIVHRILRETIRGAAPTSGVYRPPGEIAPEHGVAAERGVPLLAASPLPEARTEELRARLGPVTRHCSARERRAADIENRATTVKTLEHMRGFLEEEFDGYITSVLTWGFFVELRKIPVEGLVHVRKLTDDFYEFDEERMILTGRQTGATFKLGDRVKVVVENVDMAALELDFVLTDASSAKSTGGKRGEASQRKRAREERHTARQPRRGGFQRRGRR